MEEKYGRSGFSAMYLLGCSFRYNSTCFIQSFRGVTQPRETWVRPLKYLLLASSSKCHFEDRKITDAKLGRFCKRSGSIRESTCSKLNRRTIFVISIGRIFDFENNSLVEKRNILNVLEGVIFDRA